MMHRQLARRRRRLHHATPQRGEGVWVDHGATLRNAAVKCIRSDLHGLNHRQFLQVFIILRLVVMC
jgi:hypothetical protein